MLLPNDSKKSKMETEWLVPYTICKHVRPSDYEIYNNKHYTVHVNRLKLYYQ